MANKTVNSFTNARGQKLHTVEWLPAPETEVKAAIFFQHGFGEYIERFDAVFQTWTAAGIAVYGFDTHGMGLSEPLDVPSRALVRKFTHLVDDALQCLDEVVQPSLKANNITAPLFIAGNSLGGLVASYVVLARPDTFAGLVMQSPAIDVEWTPVLKFQAAVGGALALLVPRAKLVPAVKPEMLSQDPAAIQAYLDDPLVYKGNVKALSGNEILKGFRGLVPKRAAFKLPIFAVHGTMDKCTSLPALKEHLKHVGSTDVTLHEVAGGYHELLYGPEKEEVKALISAWVLAKAAEPRPAVAAVAKEVPAAAAAAAVDVAAASAAPGAVESVVAEVKDVAAAAAATVGSAAAAVQEQATAAVAGVATAAEPYVAQAREAPAGVAAAVAAVAEPAAAAVMALPAQVAAGATAMSVAFKDGVASVTAAVAGAAEPAAAAAKEEVPVVAVKEEPVKEAAK